MEGHPVVELEIASRTLTRKGSKLILTINQNTHNSRLHTIILDLIKCLRDK